MGNPPGARSRAGGAARRGGTAGLAAAAISVGSTLAVALAGPSLMEPALPGRPAHPPWAFAWRLAPPLAVALTAAAVAAGAAGLALCLRAAHHGWTFPPRVLLAAGIIAAAVLSLTPPFGSSDHLSYAAYGRMAVTGHDPYTTTPAMLARLGDPVAAAAQDWRGSPSVYGSLAVAGQALAARIGGSSPARIVFVLSMLNLLAFAGTALLLHRLAGGDRRRQFRAALLWAANPLLLQVLVAGAHVDSQAIVFAVAALAVFALGARSPDARGASSARQFGVAAAAGAAAGLGFAVKLSMLLVPAGLALAAVLARRPGRRRDAIAVAGGLAVGFGAVCAASFVPWGLGSLTPALHAGSYVSIGSPWRVVRSALRLATGEAVADNLVKAGAVMLMAVLVGLFLRRLAGWAADRGGGDPVPVAAAATFALVFAWLAAWPYVLPWYDGLAWALLAMLPAGAIADPAGTGTAVPDGGSARLPPPWAALDWLMLARTTALAFGYLPARGIAVPAGLGWLQSVVRTGITPVILLAVAVLAVRLLWGGQPEPAR